MLELSLYFYISQVLVFIAMIVDFLSFQFKSKITISMFLATSSLLIGIHYILLSKFTAAIILFIAMTRFIVSILTSKKIYIFVFLIINTITFSVPNNYAYYIIIVM